MSITKSCNWSTFSNDKNFEYGISITIIILNAILLLFFLVKMCKLCSYAFSYSNYHVHETYKLYTISIFNILAVLLVRKTQIDLHDYLHLDGQQQNIPENDSKLLGFYIINDLFGILSVFTNNMLLLFNAFTWLAIAENCDFTLLQHSQLITSDQMENLSQQASFIKLNQNEKRKIINYSKVFSLYWFLPMMILLCLFGTLNHSEGDSWCTVISVSIIISVFSPNLIFCIAFGLYLKKFSEPEVSMKTKIGLVFLLLAVIARSIYYLIFIINKADAQNWSATSNMIYVIFCNLLPMLVMTLLSEVQLHREQFNIMRRSSGLIFKSTVI